MNIFKHKPRPADDLGYGILTSFVKVAGVIFVLSYGIVRLLMYILD